MRVHNPIDVTDPAVKAKMREAFLSRINEVGECWEWTGSRVSTGHGHFKFKGYRELAHRASYRMFSGEIAPGLVIDHICHNPSCVNPAHLRAATQKQNMENRSGAHSNSKSGIRGVHWDKERGRWNADVRHNGVRVRGGSFSNVADAERAVIALRNELFTHNDVDKAS